MLLECIILKKVSDIKFSSFLKPCTEFSQPYFSNCTGAIKIKYKAAKNTKQFINMHYLIEPDI